ncbi:hypothetical protein K4F52_008032 [Lecanicillium sp. MT-2017a]|nr:hypothetical protein K4F52_008032 [Lecanicillium sp. MT-2017a]
MSNATRRRNGALASCEPCRKGKTRCDHQKPKCGTCQRRGLEDKCWYHSAPLTKPRVRSTQATPSPSQHQQDTTANDIEKEQRSGQSSLHVNVTSGTSSRAAVPRPQTWPFIPDNVHINATQPPVYLPYGEACYAERLAVANELVSHLKYLKDIESFFDQVGTSPRIMILKLISVLADCHEFKTLQSHIEAGNEQGVQQYAKELLDRSSTPVTLTPTSTLEDFCMQYSGPNVRVETVGLLYSIAAQSVMHNVAHDRTKQDRFTQDMIRSSYLGLRLARDLAEHGNDILVWLAYINFQVAAVVEGDATDGWDPKGEYHPATWARLRYMIAHFREKVNRYQFRDIQDGEIAELRDLAESCDVTFNALPAHLQYTKAFWASLSPAVCFMLANMYLAYLFVYFLIYQMIGSKTGSIDPNLVQISMTILETIVQMVNARDRFGYSPRELPSLLLSNGLPAAVILTTVLQEAMDDPSKWLNPQIKRSYVLRNLSVLVLHMETVSDVSERNHAFCMQAAQAISEKLDRLLDGPTSNTTTPLPMQRSGENAIGTHDAIPDNADSLTRYLNMDGFDFNNFDFGMWHGTGDFGSFLNQWDMV